MAHKHSHSHDAVELAEKLCAARGARFTPQRRAVLELLVAQKKPIGAYDLIDLYAKKLGTRPAPPIIYRALDFLIGLGLVSKLESKNLFVPCTHPDESHSCLFFVCDVCGKAQEADIPVVERAIQKTAAASGFAMQKHVIEVEGTCRTCQRAGHT